jgi:Nse4 C-terminal
MQSTKHHKTLGREKLERIIEMCIAIENRTADPFTLNIDEIIKVVKEYFPHWQNPEELKLDAEALHHLATVIKIQSEWVKQRSTLLYTDPFLLEEKILQTGKQEMINIFLKAWNPLIEFEQISINTLAQGLLYWEALTPINDRWKELEPTEVSNSFASREELIKQRVLSDVEFSDELTNYWEELKNFIDKKGVEGKIHYWDFIGAETYEETVQRAFLASFLVTYGYATLQIDRLEEEVFIEPFDQPRTELLTQQSTSVAIAVSFEDWQKWKRGELD